MTNSTTRWQDQLRAARRSPDNRGHADWDESAPDAFNPLPRLMARRPGISLADAADRGGARVRALLDAHGAVVFAGFDVADGAALLQLADRRCSGAMPYGERSTPRRELNANLYTVTEYPAHQRIELHCENSYAHTWPGTLFFWCLRPADQGGENLLADMRQVLAAIAPATRERFEQRRVLYQRELGPPLGMPWQTVFQCTARAQAQAICDDRGYRIEWHDDDRASLCRVGNATIVHPRTGQSSWFNHALFFHPSSLEPSIRDGLRRLYGDYYLPHRSAFGDGSEIGEDDLRALRQAHIEAERRLLLGEGEVVVIDNLLMAHGRCAFAGRRDIRLVMGGTWQ